MAAAWQKHRGMVLLRREEAGLLQAHGDAAKGGGLNGRGEADKRGMVVGRCQVVGVADAMVCQNEAMDVCTREGARG